MLVCLGCSHGAAAQRTGFHSFAEADGLTNFADHCLRQDRSGYILACTNHGVYVYDGKSFDNLGPAQGLPEGGVVLDLAVGADGRIILYYPDRIFVSEDTRGASRSPQMMLFHEARSDIGPIYNDYEQQFTAWNGGAILIDHGHLYFVDVGSADKPARIRGTVGLLAQPSSLIDNAQSVFGSGRTLWVALLDGEICALTTLSYRCYGPSQGLPARHWTAFLQDGKDHLLARSTDLLARIDLRHGTAVVERLPDQGTTSATYGQDLMLARTPGGGIMTQSTNGLMVRGRSGWKSLTAANGLPMATVSSVLFDHQKNLWVATPGAGVMRALGFGRWESWDHRDGLSSDMVWQITRQPDGPLWVATDRGVDAVGGSGNTVLARRHYDTAAYAIAAGAFDHVWRSLAPDGLSCIATATGSVDRRPLPSVNQILRGDGDRLWLMTEGGIYSLDDVSRQPALPRHLDGISGPVTSAVLAADGTLWLIQRGQLLHRHADGSIVTVVRNWDQPGFFPLAIAIEKHGSIWIAGAGGGAYRLDIANDRVVRSERFTTPDILSSTAVSVLVDHRGWVWVGSESGVSVFDGSRWVSADAGVGLVSNDLSQGGLFEDSDGSIWIGTGRGLSHLMEPNSLFEKQAFRPVITSVMLGGSRYAERAVAYSREPLTLGFGALETVSDVRFRYRMDGVDKSWADTGTGEARYPSMPPGHHRFTVIAYDPLTHQSSAPISVVLRMNYPWWRWWPIEALYGLAGAAVIYGAWRLRYGYLLRQQRILHREVELRTKEIREAQAALLLQATQDSLTGLLTRGEVQKRLVEALAREDPPCQLTIGLVDIDHFKRINDHFGHLAGDEILREMGQRLRAALQSGEHAGRYGGEEILIVLGGAGKAGLIRTQDLKIAICGQPFVLEDEVLQVTCSVGVAQTRHADDWKTLIGRADKALYHAKAQGRDRVVEAERMTSIR